MHVRRGDKAHVDSAYRDLFGGKMTPEFFLGLMVDEGLHKCKPPDCVVFVATDELNRTWFDPFREAGYALRFADDLKQPPLLDALSSFPQPLWPDVLAILEQIVCIHATEGFVGSLPSTLSGHVINARHAAAAALGGASAASGRHNGRPLFTKLHESCCDERTAVDLLRLPGVTTLADVPCEPHEGNPWC